MKNQTYSVRDNVFSIDSISEGVYCFSVYINSDYVMYNPINFWSVITVIKCRCKFIYVKIVFINYINIIFQPFALHIIVFLCFLPGLYVPHSSGLYSKHLLLIPEYFEIIIYVAVVFDVLCVSHSCTGIALDSVVILRCIYKYVNRC